jgi:hypothetical protein
VLPVSVTRQADIPATPDLGLVADRLTGGLEALGVRHARRPLQ